MSKIQNLPAELEENLARTVEHVFKRRGYKSSDLDTVLQTVSKAVKLETEFCEIISKPEWIEGFRQRWSHKIYSGNTPQHSGNSVMDKFNFMGNVAFLPRSENTVSSKQEFTHTPIIRTLVEGKTCEGRKQNPTQKILKALNNMETDDSNLFSTQQYSELHGSASNLSMSHIFQHNEIWESNGSEAKRKKLDEFYDEDDPVYAESDRDSPDILIMDENDQDQGPFQETSYWSEDTDEESTCEFMNNIDTVVISDSNEEEIDGNSSNENHGYEVMTARRAQMGLRNNVKPVVRFQVGVTKQDKEKKIKRRKKYNPPPSDEESSSDNESPITFPTEADDNEEDSKQFKDDKRNNFDGVRNGDIEIQNLCLACGTSKDIVAKHPLFIGGLCGKHKTLFHEWFFKYDSDGYHSCCSVCCMGNKVVLCDIQDCGRCYCRNCLDTMVYQGCFDEAVKSNHWACSFCSISRIGLLKKRPGWQEEIQRLYQNQNNSQFPPFPVPAPIPVQYRRPIRVLSLFDGIATGIVALKQLGLQIEKFIASEINEDAIRLVQNKHPEVVHVGDITKLTDDEIYRLGPFDLLLGGSPCNDLSGANPRRRGLLDAEGSGCLFFDFYRVLRTIEPPRGIDGRKTERPFFWLFENVVSMKGIEKRRICRFLQCEPKMADARNVSAAARPRLFWGNLPGLKDRQITPGVKDRLSVQECLEPGRTAMVDKLNTITTKYTCLYQGQARKAPVKHGAKEDVLWTTEIERIFGVPEHYTDVNNLGPRERLTLLGRSWSVPVVRLLLSPLKEYFSGVQSKDDDRPSSTWWN